MKKAIFMGFVFLVLAFGSTSYMNYLNSGKMVLPFANFFQGKSAESLLGDLKDTAASATEEISSKVPAKSNVNKVYKWQDEQGQWHYGSKAPEEAANAKALSINPNQNVMQAVKVPEPEVAAEPKKPAQAVVKPNPYSPAQVKETIEEAKNVQNLLNERLEAQNKALETLGR